MVYGDDLNPDDAACVPGVNVLNVTLAQIVAALGIPGNVIYRRLPDFFGTDTLTMMTNDNGNTGTGGALSDADHGTITVKPSVSGTPGDDAFTTLPGSETVDGQAGEGRLTLAPPGALTTANGFDYVYYLQHNPVQHISETSMEWALPGCSPARTTGWDYTGTTR